MRAPDGRTFRPKTQADVNRDGRRTDDILSRRLDRQPKVAPVEAVVGLIGTTEAFSDTYITPDNRSLEFVSWEFTKHDFYPGGGGPTCQEVVPGQPEFNVVEPGWYQAHAQVTYYVSASGGVPAYVDLELNGRSVANTDAVTTDRVTLIADGGSMTLVRKLHSGHFYHPGPSVENHYLNVALTYPNTPGIVIEAASCQYIIDRVF